VGIAGVRKNGVIFVELQWKDWRTLGTLKDIA